MKPPNIGIYLNFWLCLLIFFSTHKVLAATDVQNNGFEISTNENQNKLIPVCQEFDPDDDQDIDQVLGMDCGCRDDTVACYGGRYRYKKMEKISTNIEILKDNFTLKVALFHNTEIKTLKKDFILPGSENTVKELYFNSNQMKDIENEAFDKFAALKKLSIIDNELKNISENVLTEKIGLTLEELNLRNNQLESISSKAFKNMKNLTSLNLSENKGIQFFEKIDGKNISIFHESLSNLKTLNLMGCNILTLPENIFENLRSLESLDLSLNPLTSIPKAIKNLPNLRSLRILGITLTQINNNDIKFNTKLESLIIYDSKISRIDDCTFCNLPNLKKVDFSNNANLLYFHENAFGALTTGKTPELKYFSIENCNVSTLSENLLDWKNITHVDIKGNPFTCNCSMAWLINDIEEYKNNFQNLENQTIIHSLKCQEPSELKNIKFYNLAGNFCKNDTEDHSFEDDSHIIYVCGPGSTESGCTCYNDELRCRADYWWNDKKLKMNHTNIQILANNFTIKRASFIGANITFLVKEEILPDDEKKIENLVFQHTHIESIENGMFDAFISLLSLTISESKLTNISEGVLTSKLGSTLLELDLSHNDFKNLSTNAFQNLIKLKSLTFDGNKMIQWSKYVFPKALENLETLDLGACDLEILPDLSMFKNLSSLNLWYNPALNLSNKPFSSSLSTLKKLDLTSCGLSNLDENVFINLKNLETLNIEDNGFATIPSAFGKLINLRHLKANFIEILKFGDLQNNSKLESFTSYHSKLKRIEDCAFCNLTNLKSINLRYNNELTYIHENAFGGVSTGIPKILDSFVIENCRIPFLSENLLDWKNFKHFDADGNRFACNCSMGWLINDLKSQNSIYANVFKGTYVGCYKPKQDRWSPIQFKNLPECVTDKIIEVCEENTLSSKGCTCDNQELHCHFGSKKHFDSTNIQILDSNFVLKNAYFNSNHIQKLFKGKVIPGREATIETLDLRFNSIDFIEKETFDNFTSLKTLILEENSLKSLSDGIFTESIGRTLEKLDLSSNKLAKLNFKIFSNLTKLNSLLLANNEKLGFLFKLNETIFPLALANLKILDLSGCQIENLPENIFVNLKNLQILGLKQNPLTSIPKAINALSNIRELHFQETKIISLNSMDLKHNSKLEWLDVSIANISFIENCTFCELPNLKILDLKNNPRLSFIHENAFGLISGEPPLKNFKTFSISNCNISSLSENLLDWNKIESIQIDGNTLKCDCSIAWLIQGLKPKSPWYFPKLQNSVKNQDKLICNFPNEMKNIKFSNISEHFCFNETFKEMPPKTHFLWWIVFGVLLAFVFIAIGVGSFIYVRRYRSQTIPYRREDEDKLEEDFDTNDDEEENV